LHSRVTTRSDRVVRKFNSFYCKLFRHFAPPQTAMIAIALSTRFVNPSKPVNLDLTATQVSKRETPDL
jgi:hypothetical protein